MWPLPIETIKMAQSYVALQLIKIGGRPIYRENFITEKTARSLTRYEKKSRNSAVKIINGGHGSGSLLNFNGTYVVITAQHVIDGLDIGAPVTVMTPNKEVQVGYIAYSDPESDIGFIYLKRKFKSRRAVRYFPSYKLNEIPKVGSQIIYSGYPSSLNLLSIRGAVAGFEKDKKGRTIIILNTFGWFGCSGSGVFNSYGELIGVLFAVSVDQGQVLDNIIWVSPMANVDNYILMKNICTIGDASFCPKKP